MTEPINPAAIRKIAGDLDGLDATMKILDLCDEIDALRAELDILRRVAKSVIGQCEWYRNPADPSYNRHHNYSEASIKAAYEWSSATPAGQEAHAEIMREIEEAKE